MDHKEYLLRTHEDIITFKIRMGKTLAPAMASVRKYIASIPPNAWIDYLRGVPQKNIPKIIGCICIYICEEMDFYTEDIDFNSAATMIRVRRYQWEKPSDLLDNENHREKVQNNGSPKQ